jgi:SAM-dependent methyltransferase
MYNGFPSTISKDTMQSDPGASAGVPYDDATAIARRYRETRQHVRWPVPPALEAAAEVTLRNGFAERLATRPPEEICLRYAACTAAGMRETMRLADRHVLDRPLEGVGIELGAGCGLLSAVVAASPLVRHVLAVEVCAPQVELLIPKVAAYLLGPQADKVVPVVGSFDDLRVPDASLDFAVEYHSYHHSGDLPRTMRELARVLRPGGVALLFDRVRPDSMTDAEIESLLSAVYPQDFLESYHYPADLRITRLEHGEHEYRQREWQAALAGASLRIERQVEFHPKVSFTRAVKGLVSVLPAAVRSRIYQTDNATPATTWQYVVERAGRLTPAGRARILGPHRDTVLRIRKPA